MANFDLNSPFTFRTASTNFTGGYYYDVKITPDDPTRYKGPLNIRVTSSRLLTENEILAEASDIAQNTNSYQYGGTPLSIDIIGASINPNLVPEV